MVVTEIGATARGGADTAVIEVGDAPFLSPARESVGESAAPTLSSGEGQIIIESTAAEVAVTEVGAAARGGADTRNSSSPIILFGFRASSSAGVCFLPGTRASLELSRIFYTAISFHRRELLRIEKLS